MPKTTVRIAIWAAAAAVAVGASTAAVAAASAGRAGHVLSPADVARALADDDRSGEAVTGSPVLVPGDGAKYVSGQGGTVVVACEGDQAVLVSWSPNEGYRADDPVRGPAAKASVEFESDTADDVTVQVTCVAGAPQVDHVVDADDHGGDGGGHDGGDGSGDGGGDSGRDHPEDN